MKTLYPVLHFNSRDGSGHGIRGQAVTISCHQREALCVPPFHTPSLSLLQPPLHQLWHFSWHLSDEYWSEIKTSRFLPQYPEAPRKGTKKLMSQMCYTPSPKRRQRCCGVTAYLSVGRTSFNTKKQPQSYAPMKWHSVWGHGVGLHQALWASLSTERKQPRNRLQIFSSCITADISPCSYKTPPCRIPQPWLPGFCDLHVPGILMIVVL